MKLTLIYSLSVCRNSPAIPATYVERENAGRDRIQAEVLSGRKVANPNSRGRGGWKRKSEVLLDVSSNDSRVVPPIKRRRHADDIMAAEFQFDSSVDGGCLTHTRTRNYIHTN